MSKLRIVLALAATMASVTPALSAPVPGNPVYVTLYNAVFSSCTIPAGTVVACEAAIVAYSDRLVADVGTVTEDAALTSFRALRAEVFAANTANPLTVEAEAFRGQIDELFEFLIPESGAIAIDVSPV